MAYGKDWTLFDETTISGLKSALRFWNSIT